MPGIETIVKEAEEERAEIAKKKAAAVVEQAPEVSEHKAEADATRKYLDKILAEAKLKYKNASPVFRNELCIVVEAIEGTRDNIVKAFYKEE